MHTNRREYFFLLILLLKKDAKMVINGKTRTRFTFVKIFREDFVTGVKLIKSRKVIILLKLKKKIKFEIFYEL